MVRLCVYGNEPSLERSLKIYLCQKYTGEKMKKIEKTEKRLKSSKDKICLLFFLTPEGHIIVEAETLLTLDRFLKALGYLPEGMEGKREA